MILNAYTLHDSKTLVYNQPFFAMNHGVARRMVTDVASDMNTSVGRHPRDYTLYCIGQYDDQTGFLAPLDIREHVADVIQLVAPTPQPNLFDK